MASTPRNGPIASVANAHRQPSRRTAGGIIQMLSMVSAKPAHVCVVSAVPT